MDTDEAVAASREVSTLNKAYEEMKLLEIKYKIEIN